jgi:V/A-type H+-transporting ATPase subunit D
MSTINTTRLERNNQISRMRVARRGHKLLKDKSDEMTKNLADLKAQKDSLRANFDNEIAHMLRLFLEARVYMTSVEIVNAIAAVRCEYGLKGSQRNVFGLVVPELEIVGGESDEKEQWHFNTTHPDFDHAVNVLQGLMPRIVKLACIEKTCGMLEAEIKKIRRRINAIEYAVIPKIKQNISYINLKLAENERGNLVRLMKVKNLKNE